MKLKSPTRPVVRYHGGKWHHAPWIIGQMPEHRRYVEPPYVMDSRTDSDADYRHEMTDADHEALATALLQVKGKVMLSGYHSKLYDGLFAAWPRVERKAYADGARERTEVLYMNFKPEGLLL